jgi:phytoene synthase
MEIARSHAGNATHPACQALQVAITAFDLPQAPFLQIIESHEQDLHQAVYSSFAELDAYCRHVGGTLQQLTAKIGGFQQQETLDYALKLGTAIQFSHILRNTHADSRRGKLYLPRDEMSQHGISEKDFIQPRCSDNMQDLLTAQIARADDYFAQALSLLPAQDRAAQRYGLIQGAIYRTMLDKLQKNHCRVLTEQISLSPLRKLWIAWRTH